jgi:nitrite reductase/ring-hydroxylating ferredoxin subunit
MISTPSVFDSTSLVPEVSLVPKFSLVQEVSSSEAICDRVTPAGRHFLCTVEHVELAGSAPRLRDLGVRVFVPELETDLVVFCVGGQYWAVERKCPHKRANLEKAGEAKSDMCLIECAAHGYGYDPQTGENVVAPPGEPKSNPLRTFRVVEVGGDLFLE